MRTLVLFVGLAMGGCAAAPGTHVTRIDADAIPYQQAHAICWQEGMGTPTGAPGARATRMHAYAECIREHGWDDRWAIL